MDKRVCSPLEQAGEERERVKEREKGEPYTRIPDSGGASKWLKSY